ncbi:MAG: hypothetical protein BM565_04045 [Gammaproteobacteria bacterium MedPE]|nr:MAG: hypothetical protein BM565_04045 [Gammaproteobacteria bacterium MedPE]
MTLTNELPDIHTIDLLELLQFTSQLSDSESVSESAYFQLDELIRQVQDIARDELSSEGRWRAFKELFYKDWQFTINEDDYFSVESNNLFYFLETRNGNNALSSILVFHLLNLLELRPKIIDFPGPFVLQVDGIGGIKIDPLSGKEMSHRLLEGLVRGHLGDHIRLTDEHLEIATLKDIKKRFLVSLKQACLLDEEYDVALLLSELLLTLLPDDPNIIMERGFILQQLDYATGAMEDFSYFIEQCPEHPNSDVLKVHIDKLKDQAVVRH